MVQWLRIRLLMRGTWLQSLVGGLRSHRRQGSYAQAPQRGSPERPQLLTRCPLERVPRNRRNRPVQPEWLWLQAAFRFLYTQVLCLQSRFGQEEGSFF